MIEISQELQKMYSTDGNIKHIKIYLQGSEIILSNEDIISESFTLTEILSDEEQINYGLCNSSKIEFTTINDNNIEEGSIISIYILIGNNPYELPLGTYIVDSATKQTNKSLKNIIAYDRLYHIDNTDMIYFYEHTIFPLTLRQLRDNFFKYVAIDCNSIDLLNDNLTVNDDNDFRGLSAREFLSQICELNAVFGKMTRYDTFQFLDITEMTEISFTGYPIRTVETENFQTKRINRIKVIESGGAVLYNLGLGNDEPNFYNIKDNFLLIGRTADDETLQNTINILYTKMNSLCYTPCTVTSKGLPYLETGDSLTINKDNQTIRTYILSRTLKGIIALTDEYKANGVNTLREVYSTEENISQDVYNSYQNNRFNYLLTDIGNRIILPTTRTNAISQTFGNTSELSSFEYMGLVTATIHQGGTLKFEYRLDGETLPSTVLQTAESPGEIMSLANFGDTDIDSGAKYQQIVLYLPQTNSAIGTHTLEIDVISDATGYIDRSHWISCIRGQNVSNTSDAVISIIIIDLPDKLEYYQNEELDLTGLVVGANYLGGNRKILSSDEYTVTSDTSIIGKRPVTITYKENTNLKTSFNITIKPKDIEPSEYIKVQEYYIGQKFLESYEEQSVYTNVYWVHEYQGQMIETYLSTSQLNSWECDTLEPYMYLNGATKYVGYYKIPAGDKFGQHDMKITYKSPETGNLLSVEYPIYHLKELEFNIGDTINWYPFRLALHLENFGYGTLTFECNDNNRNAIRETKNVIRNLNEIKYNFPNLGVECNAMFKFGDGQLISYEYISMYTHKLWHGNSIWNIRPYWHSENTNTLDFGAIDKQNIKDLRCTEFGININNDDKIYTEDVYSLTWQEHSRNISSGGEELNDTTNHGGYQLSGYVSENTWVAPTMETLYATVSRQQISSNEYLDICQSMNLRSLTQFAKFYTTMKFEVPLFWNEFHLNNETQIQKYPEVGYVYWGDGTFDYYRPGNYRLYQDKNIVTSQKFDEISYQNGRKLNGNNLEANYYQPFLKIHQDHTYEKNGLYNVIITSPYQAQSVYHNYSNTKFVTQGILQYLYPYSDDEGTLLTRDWNYGNVVDLITNESNVYGTSYQNVRLRAMIIGQANGEETGYKAHVIPFIPLCNQVKSLYVGRGSMMGIHNYYVNNNSSLYAKNSYYGNDGIVKFTHEIGLLPGVGADGSITLLPVYNINVVDPSSTGDNININDGCLAVKGTPLDYLTSLKKLTIVGLSPTIRCHNKQSDEITTGAISHDHLIWYAPSLNGLEYLSSVANFDWVTKLLLKM